MLRRPLVFLFSFLIFHYTISCTYFRAKKGSPEDIMELIREGTVYENAGKIYKYYILHQGEVQLSLIDISIDSTTLSGRLVPLQKNVYYSPDRKKNRVKSEEKSILNEVHFYLHDRQESLQEGSLAIPLTDVKEIRIIKSNTGKSIAAFIGFTAVTFAATFVVAAAYALATKSSCPYVYSYDGEDFVFEGEIFGGAILQNLERTDYLPLPSLEADRGLYRVRISNELKERQYTDFANLIAINHPEGTQALVDNQGKAHIISNLQAPVVALTANDHSVLSVLEQTDRALHYFNEEGMAKNNIELTFDNRAKSKSGKLVINAKNTMWFDYLYGEVISKFGNYYPTWIEKQAKLSAEERLEKIKASGAPLSVYLKSGDSWALIEQINTIGPMADRDMVIPLDLSHNEGNEVQIKIETGFMFWELDYAAVDFSENSEFERYDIQPHFATDSNEKDWLSALMEADRHYMAQFTIGEQVELRYQAPAREANQQQSLFLHTRGYYELIRDFKGLPQLTELIKFQQPDYLMQYSMEEYIKFTDPGTGQIAD